MSVQGRDLVVELTSAMATVRQALDYGDKEWLSSLLRRSADHIEKLEILLVLVREVVGNVDRVGLDYGTTDVLVERIGRTLASMEAVRD